MMTRSEFQTTNTELRQKRLDLVELDEVIRLKEKEREAWESAQMLDICGLLNPENGKPLHSNPERRDAELAIRQTASPDWTTMDELLASYRCQAARLKADINYLDNDIRWGLSHAADEVNALLGEIAARVEMATNEAAATAVKHLMAEIAAGYADASSD